MAKIPTHVQGSIEEITAEASELIRDQLCKVWDWPEDDPEAQKLAQQLAQCLFAAVEDTYTQPLTLLKALLAPRPSEFHHGADVIKIREK